MLVNTNLASLRNMTSKLNKILSFMMQPEIWRFVCFVSSIVGLLCYDLSSSLNHLFGNWNLLKVVVYCGFSFIICLAILFANTWPNSPSLRFRAHLMKLILVIFRVSLSYSLIILRFYLDAAIESVNLGLPIQDQHPLVTQVHENSHLILPQETIDSESAPIMNSGALQENVYLIQPQETINSESALIINFGEGNSRNRWKEVRDVIHNLNFMKMLKASLARIEEANGALVPNCLQVSAEIDIASHSQSQLLHTLDNMTNIQIRRLLMQPKVWRFVGFASSVVGLLCYALSSSFIISLEIGIC
ncbi:unnamed protein product [Trifolium pratense]|uniref:Uncharacterized protein n=1 Tax=Trifolium pratense TaxID=57577 RepID=A0ACB0KAC4_TRIPR|nr:unnamed protein product [Trifolium pratense]